MSGFDSKRQASKSLLEPQAEPVVPGYTEGHCAEKAKKGGCQLHNLHCGYPACDRKPTSPPAPAVAEPLTDEQIDEIWDGSFDSEDPKRQLSFRQIITRAIEAHHGIKEKT